MWNLDEFDDFTHLLRRSVSGPLKRFGDVLAGSLIMGAVALSLIVWKSTQAHEIFRILLEAENPFNTQNVLGILAVTILSGLLFFTYRNFLLTVRARRVRYSLNEEGDGAAILWVGRTGLYAVAASPWIACALSMLSMRSELIHAREELSKLLQQADLRPDDQTAVYLMNLVLDRTFPAIVILSVLGLMTLVALRFCTRKHARRLHIYAAIVPFATAWLIFLVFGVIAAFFDLTFLRLYQDIGSFGTSMMAAIGLFAIGLAFAWAARASGLATFFGALLLVGVYVFAVWLEGPVSEGIQTAGPNAQAAGETAGSFKKAVTSWISAAATALPEKTRFPLLIVSAQGGGMYAAIESSLFMARVQDAEPRFNRSIFAISAVSGGAIGAGLYQGFADGHACKKAGTSTSDEAPAGKQASIEERISKLVLKPHLAPVIGNIPADVVRSVMSIVSVRIDRSEAFKQSLLEDCPALDTPYEKYWDPAGARPALILNTTWMSNGHRVAFAPFPLKAIGDGTLWSFDDVYQGLHPLYRNKPFSPSVADAVIASARFPAVLPPLGLTVGAHRHNFGDGGYADASGVTTALEIFQAAKRLTVKDPRIVPRLVMLTFDYEKVEAEKEDGTTFGETVAPISAILGVRENLAGQAITRAQALPGAEGEIWRVSLNPDDFGIALGLQLSRTSYETLSLLLGRPEWCKESPYDAANPILKNSCVAQKVLDFVRKLG